MKITNDVNFQSCQLMFNTIVMVLLQPLMVHAGSSHQVCRELFVLLSLNIRYNKNVGLLDSHLCMLSRILLTLTFLSKIFNHLGDIRSCGNLGSFVLLLFFNPLDLLDVKTYSSFKGIKLEYTGALQTN